MNSRLGLSKKHYFQIKVLEHVLEAEVRLDCFGEIWLIIPESDSIDYDTVVTIYGQDSISPLTVYLCTTCFTDLLISC